MLRKLPFILAMVASLAGLSGLWWYYVGRHRLGTDAVASLRQRMKVEDPLERMAAAEKLLVADPEDFDARVVKATAALDLRRPTVARSMLLTVKTQGADHESQVLQAMVSTCLAEVQVLLDESTQQSIGEIERRSDTLLSEADSRLTAYSKLSGASADIRIQQIRVQELRSLLRQEAIRGPTVELARYRVLDSEAEIEAAADVVQRRQAQLEKGNKELESACDKELSVNTDLVEPRVIQARLLLRQGKLEAARQRVADLIKRGGLSYEQAGVLAHDLLNLETVCLAVTTKDDVALAGQLMSSMKWSGRQTYAWVQARAEWMLSQGRGEEVETLVRAAMVYYEGDRRLLLLQAAAMASRGRSAEAVEIVRRLNQKAGSAAGSYLLGQLLIAGGQAKEGLVALQKALSYQPDLLTARALLVKTMIDREEILEVETDIGLLQYLTPGAPLAAAMKTRLLLAKDDLASLMELLNLRVAEGKGGAALTAAEVAMCAAMVMDDDAWVMRLLEPMTASRPDDVLVLLASHWRKASSGRRAYLARYFVEAMTELFEADPFQRPRAPMPARILRDERARMAATMPSDSSADLTALEGSRFIPWPEEMALTLVGAAMGRWPDDMELRRAGVALNLLLSRDIEAKAMLAGMPDRAPGGGRDWLDAVRDWLWGRPDEAAAALKALRIPGKPATVIERWLTIQIALREPSIAPAVAASVEAIKEHPWGAILPLPVLRRALVARDKSADGLIERIGSTNRALSLLLAARANVARGAYEQAIQEAREAQDLEPGNRYFRWLLADVFISAHLAMGRRPLAEDVFSTLLSSWPQDTVTIMVLWSDMLAGIDPDAAVVTLDLAVHKRPTTARNTDLVLSRCLIMMDSQKLMKTLEELITASPVDPLPRLYQAVAHQKAWNLKAAMATIEWVLERRPGSPRAMLIKARLCEQLGKPDRAREVYSELIGRGGGIAQAAREDLQRMEIRLAPPTPAPDRSGVHP